MKLTQNAYTRALAVLIWLATIALQPMYGQDKWYVGLTSVAVALGLYHMPTQPPKQP